MIEEQASSPPANGSGAAAVLAAAIGGCTLGVVALTADAMPGIARLLNIWRPTGPLSGVTDIAILVWLVSWIVFARWWAGRDLNMRWINRIAALLLLAGLLLTFPPFMDLLQGK